MFANEIQARQGFTEASKKLEEALAEYSTARKRLHEITGEFVGTDRKATLQFTTADGRHGQAQIELTNC